MRPRTIHLELDDGFWDPVVPARFPKAILRHRHDDEATRLGLSALDDDAWRRHFHAFEPLPGNLERPLALRYHGHQFQSYNPQLGDGRGFLFAQLEGSHGVRDLGTKGSGTTPWSRGGDGRLTLQGGVREVLAAEMLEALGVPTCRILSLFETGEALQRNDEPSPTRSAVLVRSQRTHVRFGTFQRLAAHEDATRLRTLVEWCLRHHDAAADEATRDASADDRVIAFFRGVVERTAELVAAWTVAGFVHGVLNTDNFVISGESFDYGPWRFLPSFQPGFTAAYFDHGGLYAFARQPEAALWNLERLADALTLISPDDARYGVALDDWRDLVSSALTRRFCWRLGIDAADGVGDRDAASAATLAAALELLHERRAPAGAGHTPPGGELLGWDQFFHDWRGGLPSKARALAGPCALAYRGPSFEAFERALESMTPRDGVLLALAEDPAWQRPSPVRMTHDVVVATWTAIAEDDDWSPFETLLRDVRAFGQRLGPGQGEG